MGPNIRLDSFLVSSSAGMDLSKGVPEVRAEAKNPQLKDELSFEEFLDRSIKSDQEAVSKRPDLSDRQGEDDLKDAPVNQVQKESISSEPAKPVEHKEVLKRAVKVSQVKTGELPSEDVLEAVKADGKALVIDEVAEDVLEAKVEGVKALLPGDIDLGEESAAVPVVELAQSAELITEDLRAFEETAVSTNIDAMAQGEAAEVSEEARPMPAELQPVIDELVEAEAVMDENLEIEEKSLIEKNHHEALGAELDENLQEIEEPSVKVGDLESSRKSDIKDFAAELWIHRNVDAESKFAGRSEINVELAADGASPKPILMRDMTPLISKVLLTKTGGEMSLQLRPAHLGSVKIDLMVEGDSVRVSMQTEKASASSFLQSQISELKQQFQAVGLKVDSVSISTSQGNASEQARDGHHHQHSKQNHENAREQTRQDRPQREFVMDDWNEEAA